MNLLKSSKLLVFVIIGLLCLTSSCKKDDDTDDMEAGYKVAVQIISPSEGAAISTGQEFTIEVDFKRSGNIIHNILVEIVDENDKRVQKLVERHAHVPNEFTFKQAGIVMNTAGTYKVRAMTVNIDETDILGSKENNLVVRTFVVK